MAKVTLDMETFKALASDTRLGVLRALDERRKTLTELSKELELNKATVHEHLALLTATGLIKKRDDEGRKWIYYELTWRGERLLHPESTTTFAVLLGISVAAAGGGVALLGRALDWWWQEKQMPDFDSLPENSGGHDADTAETAAAPEDDASADDAADDSADDAGMADESMEDTAFADGDEEGVAMSMGEGDEDGILAILLLITSLILAGLAFVVRRAGRRNA